MTPDEKQIIKKCLDETLDSMTRAAAEKDLQKDIVARIKEETTLQPKVFRKMASVAYRANFSEEVAIHEEFEEIFTEIMGVE